MMLQKCSLIKTNEWEPLLRLELNSKGVCLKSVKSGKMLQVIDGIAIQNYKLNSHTNVHRIFRCGIYFGNSLGNFGYKNKVKKVLQYKKERDIIIRQFDLGL